MGRARVEGHIAIYESVKVILVVGVALSLSFSSPLQPLASHSFVARRSSRPLSSSPSSRSLPPPPLLLLRTLLLRTSLVARRGRRWRSSLITSTRSVRIIIILPPSIVAVAVAARDCFALPKSFYVILCRPVRGIASRSRAASLALIIDNIDSVCAHHHHSSTVDRRCGCRRAGLLRAPEEILCLQNFFVFKISGLCGTWGKTYDSLTENEKRKGW